MKLLSRLFFLIALLIAVSNLNAQNIPKFEQPVLLSSAGQSADVKLAAILFKKRGIEAKTINMAKVEDLNGIKTLVMVPGFSSKGLGAAGISAEDEMQRVKNLIAAAKEKKIPVVLLHIGGKARRKGQSDNFIKAVSEIAKYMIVVKQGNEDNFFTDLSNSLKIPLILVEKIPDAEKPIGEIFK
jgi:hypothetical protein